MLIWFPFLQVSRNLQDRLGLAKVRFEQLQRLNASKEKRAQRDDKTSSDSAQLTSDALSEPFTARPHTPLTSPLPTTTTVPSELPRSARSRHAATFDIQAMEAMTSGSRKRRRRNPIMRESFKVSRINWERVSRPQNSSPAVHRRSTYAGNHNSFISESDTIPDGHHSDDTEPDPDLPRTNGPNAVSSSVMSSSPPRTPPPNRSRLAGKNNKAVHNGQGEADLLLHLANSPTPARVGRKHTGMDYLPSTPPARHANLPPMMSTPGGGIAHSFSTPTQQPFNFADFVNVTPSPAQPKWADRTPLAAPKSPLAGKEVRKRLNFNALVPPSSNHNSNFNDENHCLDLGDGLRRR